MKLLLLHIMLLLPVLVHAQRDIHVQLLAGLTANEVKFKETSSVAERQDNWGGQFDLRIWKEYGRRLQAGVAIETGSVRDVVTHRLDFYTGDEYLGERTTQYSADVLNPALGVYILANYKFILKKNWYIYAGGVAGVINGNNNVDPTEDINLTRFSTGGNIGLSIQINKRMRWSVQHTLRTLTVPPNGGKRVVRQNPSGTTLTYTPVKASVQVYNTLAGLEIIF